LAVSPARAGCDDPRWRPRRDRYQANAAVAGSMIPAEGSEQYVNVARWITVQTHPQLLPQTDRPDDSVRARKHDLRKIVHLFGHNIQLMNFDKATLTS
jgi:hypothetical protein